MAEAKVTVLPVGQGCMNLIEVYEDGILTFLGLIDCGTESIHRDEDDNPVPNLLTSIQKVQNAMIARGAQFGRAYYLDFLNISHQDKDHWILLEELFGETCCKTIMDNILIGTRPKDKTDIQHDILVGTSLVNCRETFSILKKTIITSYGFEGDILLLINPEDMDTLSLTVSWKQEVGISQFSFTYSTSELEIYILIVFGIMGFQQCFLTFNYQDRIVKSQAVAKVNKCFYSGYDNTKHTCEVEMDSFDFHNVLDYSFKLLALDEHYNDTINIPILEHYYEYLNKTCSVKYIEDQIKELDVVNDYIGTVWIGGQKDKYKSNFDDMTKDLAIYSHNRLYYVANNTMSDYSRVDGVVLGLVFCRHTSNFGITRGILKKSEASTKSIDIINNASSSVVALKIGTYVYLFTGDATVHTMYAMNNDVDYTNLKNAILTAPHHGAGRTSKGNLDGSDDQWKILDDFLKNINPSKIMISSGYKNGFGHPNQSFINKSVLYTPIGTNHAIYYSNCDSGKKGKYLNQVINDEIYTCVTVSNIDGEDCYVYMDYQFVMGSDGGLTVESEIYDVLDKIDADAMDIDITANQTEQVNKIQEDERIKPLHSLLTEQIDFLSYQL